MSDRSRFAEMLLGALVADAASLGLHWLYDVNRIKQVADALGSAAFVPIDPANFDGVPGYFAHAVRADGMMTQYGEGLALTIRSMIKTGGRFEDRSFQDAFSNYFGAGGEYTGYIDRPTRGALDNILGKKCVPSGIDDDQLPALIRIPALVGANSNASVDELETAIRITNVNVVASAYGAVFAGLLNEVLSGTSLTDALRHAADTSGGDFRGGLIAALDAEETNSVAYGELTQRACHLPMAMPLAFHILARAQSYAEAVETNIRAGGDSAGRSVIIGSVMAAVHGLDGDAGVPLDWMLKTSNASRLWSDCQTLVGYR